MLAQLASTVFYLLVFGFALLLFWIAEAQYKKDAVTREKVSYSRLRSSFMFISGGSICSALAIILLSLIAGLRATSVGSDTSGYPITFMNAAMAQQDFFDFMKDPVGVGAEPLGAILVWLCSRLRWGVWPLLFCYQFFTVLPVFLAVRKFQGRIPLTMAMAVYLFFFFNNSLNMMRQSVSCALLLLAFAIYLSERRIKTSTVLLCIAAVLFHRSGAYGVALIVLVLLVARVRRRSLRAIFYMLIIASPIAISRMAAWLISSGFADSHTQHYLEIFIIRNVGQDWFVNPMGSYSLAYLGIYTLLVFLPPLLNLQFFEPEPSRAIKRTEASLYQPLFTLNLAGYLIYITLLFTLNTMYGMRFSIYFDFFLILSIPLSSRGALSRQKKLLVLVLLVVFWWLWIVRLGWSASAAYEFFF